MIDAPDTNEPRRMPLWRNVADEMLRSGIAYGSTYTTEYFEVGLSAKHGTPAFNLGVHNVRKALEYSGFSITARGQKGKGYLVRPAGLNEAEMASFSRKAASALKRGVVLGTNTPIAVLTAEERRRHESMCAKLATRHQLFKHSVKAARIVGQHAPALLD